ncbi:hypothetical protein LguiA_025995 [Lonicera macranthoides]
MDRIQVQIQSIDKPKWNLLRLTNYLHHHRPPELRKNEFSRVRGTHTLEKAVEESLKSVNLHHGRVANKKAGKYSGGMKRRLSVASVRSPRLDHPVMSTACTKKSNKAITTLKSRLK